MSWVRCTRCAFETRGEPFLMAGRHFCCESCALGSACIHQGNRREAAVRRFDSTFDSFRDAALERSPYERRRLSPTG